jgi:hypothetical protein
MIMFPLVKPPDLHIVEWFSQRWQADMKINTTGRTYETSLSVSDEMRELFAAVHEPGYGPTEKSSRLNRCHISYLRQCRLDLLRVRLSAPDSKPTKRKSVIASAIFVRPSLFGQRRHRRADAQL